MKKEKFHEFEKRKKEEKEEKKGNMYIITPTELAWWMSPRACYSPVTVRNPALAEHRKKMENGPAQRDKGGMRPLVETTVAGA